MMGVRGPIIGTPVAVVGVNERVKIVPKEEVNARNIRAREEFKRACIGRYGYVPFNEEFFERSWPVDDGNTNDAVSEVRRATGHDA